VVKTTLTSLLTTDIRDDSVDRLETLFTHGALGTGTTAPSLAQTALVTEVFRDPIDSFDKPGGGVGTASLLVLTTEANSNAIAEVGWFNASSGGSMWVRNTMTAINKTNDIQLFVDTKLTVQVSEVT